MPKFLKDKAVSLLDGGIETYLLGLYGLTLPTVKNRRAQETKYAPVMGLFGVAAELLVKACLVQAHGISAMYKKGDATQEVFKFGSEYIEELKSDINIDSSKVAFWYDKADKQTQKGLLIEYLNKFRLLQGLRANGLHAGIGCSRDVAVVTANEVYAFIQTLSRSKKLRAYLRNVLAPESTIRDREAIIEDLSRRVVAVDDDKEKMDLLRGLYIVLPYVPEVAPDWIERFANAEIAPPTKSDINYLVKSLDDAHSIYLLKNRGGKDGIPVRVEPDNPDALPIAIQNIKRTLSSNPDQFNNDALIANTRLENKYLDLPIDDFLVDLYALGSENARIIQGDAQLTAQVVWPFVVSAYSTNETPRPCWDLIKNCDEIDKLISYVKRCNKLGNGYFRRRYQDLLKLLECYRDQIPYTPTKNCDDIFNQAILYCKEKNEKGNPFTPQYLKNNNVSNSAAVVIEQYISGGLTAGDSIEKILLQTNLTAEDKHAVISLMKECKKYRDRNGLTNPNNLAVSISWESYCLRISGHQNQLPPVHYIQYDLLHRNHHHQESYHYRQILVYRRSDEF